MTDPWEIRVYENQQLVHVVECAPPLEFGRQGEGEAAPFSRRQEGGRSRVVIAPLNEDTVSRKQALLEALPGRRIRLTNLSKILPIRLADGSEVKPQGASEISLPLLLTLGPTTIRVQDVDSSPLPLEVLPDATRPPGAGPLSDSGLAAITRLAASGMDVEALVRWLQATMGVLHSAAGSSDYFARAAQAIVDMVGLDTGRVLLLNNGDWQREVLKSAPRVAGQEDWPPSRQVLSRVRQEKRTFWQIPGRAPLETGSLAGVEAVVAAPILDRHGEVIGALYGDRRRGSTFGSSPPVTRLEAMLIELLATGVAAGLARSEQEKAALAARIQFEQFFTPELSRHLAAHPDLLTGRDADVTILFADIRAFSRISHRLGPARTVEWVSDVMSTLSDCVKAHRGVLVDYMGDEIIAMWGAPDEQPNHATLACSAARDMLAQLSDLNVRWEAILQEPMGLGIGINTGIARVGNIGSKHKFKYGPLGNTANLASRVQGATKYLLANLLITGSTHARLDAEFDTRRLCKVRVVNISEPVSLYEVATVSPPGWATLKREYERALEEFERNDLSNARRLLGNVIGVYPDDGPSLLLISRAINSMLKGGAEVDSVWELPGK